MSFVVFQIFVNLRKIQVSVVTAVTGVDFGYWHLCCSKLPAAEGALLLQEPCCCRSPAVAGALLLQEPCCCRSPAVARALLLQEPCCCGRPCYCEPIITGVILVWTIFPAWCRRLLDVADVLLCYKDKNYNRSNKRKATNSDKNLCVASFLLLQVPCCCMCCILVYAIVPPVADFSMLKVSCCCRRPCYCEPIATGIILVWTIVPPIAGFSMLQMSCKKRIIEDQTEDKLLALTRISNRRQPANKDKKI
jgi:hypothetical protein